MVKSRSFVLGLAAASLLAVSVAPAAAQVGDFFCSTFSIACDPPPPPPPAPAPLAEEAPAPSKKVRHKAKKKVAKAKAAAEPATATQ